MPNEMKIALAQDEKIQIIKANVMSLKVGDTCFRAKRSSNSGEECFMNHNFVFWFSHAGVPCMYINNVKNHILM